MVQIPHLLVYWGLRLSFTSERDFKAYTPTGACRKKRKMVWADRGV